MPDMVQPPYKFSGVDLTGPVIDRLTRTIGDLGDIFCDRDAYAKMPTTETVYKVESYFPVPDNTPGGLFFGITFIHPGTVGKEYFMTRGHFHKLRDRGEFYACIEGEGMLILMDEKRNTWAERMFPGSLHYIPGHTAHRAANTGKTILSFSAVWPSDAGYDYETISEKGFSRILLNIDGIPTLADNR